jgi:hypothetical protein
MSSMIKNRLEKTLPPEGLSFHFPDLIAYRSLSDKITAELLAAHESSQVFLKKMGNVCMTKVIGITMDDIILKIKI